MGTYLSTPVTDKCEESGESLDCPDVPCAWGVVDMQGWRKSMEDGHTAVTDIPLLSADQTPETSPADPDDPASDSAAADLAALTTITNNSNSHGTLSDAKVFGVFDGHGGPEVARFCQLYIVSVLQQQPTWRGASLPTKADSPTIPSPDDLEAAGETPVGRALRDCFHALDRMIDDPTRRQEIIQLRNAKPQIGERRDAQSIPPPVDVSGIIPPHFYAEHQTPPPPAPPPAQAVDDATDPPTDVVVVMDVDVVVEESGTTIQRVDDEEEKDMEQQPTSGGTVDCTKPEDGSILAAGQNLTVAAKIEAREEENPVITESSVETGDDNDDQHDNDGPADDDSNEATGLEEAADRDRDMMDGHGNDSGDANDANDDVDAEGFVSVNAEVGQVKTMLQKILSLGSTATSTAAAAMAGQIVVKVEDLADDDPSPDGGGTSSNTKTIKVAPTVVSPEPETTGPNARKPTLIHNGRMICNLPDHPIHAGATAIVAVLTGKILTVANAGDSRAVLCRANGAAFPLSYDHKPQQDREMTRITRAGGFVNHFGRVNGNLNLSRSIGDLKYKQVPGIPPADQMITAEPDIIQVALQDDDEFIILGCDGIWDCLSNENAVDFVRQRIDTKTPTEIGTEMLDQIISEDPRVTQGIGGDNMTIMIVDLQPSRRSFRRPPPPDDEETTTAGPAEQQIASDESEEP